MTALSQTTLAIPSGGQVQFPNTLPEKPIRVEYASLGSNAGTYLYFGPNPAEDGTNTIRLKPGTGITITSESTNYWYLSGQSGDQLQITAYAVP